MKHDTTGLGTDKGCSQDGPLTVIHLLEILDHVTSVSPICSACVSKVT